MCDSDSDLQDTVDIDNKDLKNNYLHNFDDSEDTEEETVIVLTKESLPKRPLIKKVYSEKVNIKNSVNLADLGCMGGVPLIEYDLDNIKEESKPWRLPGADIGEYFNYGFTEETWIQYCKKQREIRKNYGSNNDESNFISTEEGLGMDRRSRKHDKDDGNNRLYERHQRDRSKSIEHKQSENGSKRTRIPDKHVRSRKYSERDDRNISKPCDESKFINEKRERRRNEDKENSYNKNSYRRRSRSPHRHLKKSNKENVNPEKNRRDSKPKHSKKTDSPKKISTRTTEKNRKHSRSPSVYLKRRRE